MQRKKSGWGAAIGQVAVLGIGSGVSFDYEAPALCPNSQGFAAEVAARWDATSARPSSPRKVRVRIEAEPAGFRGRLEFDDGRAVVTRELESADCAELGRALGLVAAVLLNSEGDATSGGTNDERGTHERSRSPDLPKATPVAWPAPHAPVRSHAGHWALVARTGLDAESGALPELTLAPRLGLAAEYWANSRWGSGLGVSASPPARVAVDVEGARATIGLSAARLEGCALWQPLSRFGLAGCAAFEAGRIEGTNAASPSDNHQQLWLAPGVLLRAEVRAVGPLSIFAQSLTSLPLVRTEFFFTRRVPAASSVSAYQVPGLVLGADVGLGVRFE